MFLKSCGISVVLSVLILLIYTDAFGSIASFHFGLEVQLSMEPLTPTAMITMGSEPTERIEATGDPDLNGGVRGRSARQLVDEISEAYSQRDAARVLELSDSAIQLARQSGNRDLEAEIEIYRGETLLSIGRFEAGYDVLSSAWERLPDTQEGYKLGNLLGTAYRFQGDYGNALALYLETLEAVKQTGDKRFLAGVEQNMAVVYTALGAVDEALSRYMNSLQVMEELGDRQSEVVILNNIGELYREEDKLDLARDYLQRSHDLASRGQLVDDQSRALMNLGLVYHSMGDPEEALRHFDRSLELAEQVGHVSRPIQILYNRGRVYLDMEDHLSARQAFERSLEMSKTKGISQGAYFNRTGLGDLAAAERLYETAIEHFQKALVLAEESGSLRMQLTPLRGLWQAVASSGDETNALSHLIRYTELTDSLRNEDREEALARYQVLLNIRDQQQENELLARQVDAQQQAIFGIAAAGVMLLISLGGLLFVYRRQQRLSGLLQQRGSELSRLNQKLASQKDRLDDLNSTKDRLISVLAHDLRSPIAQLQGLAMLIRKGEDLEPETREEFLSEIDHSLSQGVSMLQDYLEWAQSQMEGLEPDIQPVNLADLTNEVLDRLQEQANEKEVHVVSKLDETEMVNADRQMLQVILQNLVSNAIKFSHPGGIVWVQMKSGLLETNGTEGSNHRRGLIVRDQGVGIPKSIQNQIFLDPASRRSGTKNEKGTGLGLILCREFAEKQGFRLTFRSTEGEGTDFCLEVDV